MTTTVLPAPAATVTPPPAVVPPGPSPAATTGPGWQPYRWTIQSYRRLHGSGLFADVKTMLLDGEIYAMPSPNPPHDIGLELTAIYLRATFPVGHFVRVQMGFDVGTRHDPSPDLAVVVGSVRDVTQTPTAALLVVEVSESTLFMDTTTKAEVYATAGVPDYWVLDLENRRLIVYRDPEPLPAGLGATAYRTRQTLGPTESVAPLHAPTAAVTVADLLP